MKQKISDLAGKFTALNLMAMSATFFGVSSFVCVKKFYKELFNIK